MSSRPTPAAAGADLAQLTLDSTTPTSCWTLPRGCRPGRCRITAGGTPVGSLTAVRGLYWKSDNLRERMADEQSFPALVAAQLVDGGRPVHPRVRGVRRVGLRRPDRRPAAHGGGLRRPCGRRRGGGRRRRPADGQLLRRGPARQERLHRCGLRPARRGRHAAERPGVLRRAADHRQRPGRSRRGHAAPTQPSAFPRPPRPLARHGQPATWDEEDDDGDGWDEDGEKDE